ncbi:tetratricopeptide repeat protein [Kitasatospora sp. NPDC094011]|uniref:tetratricopeptide repeat protein n=1 Tax=Kitasatospora sp. NPDC094011 TaxID=3364090 RepID=UPI00382B9259
MLEDSQRAVRSVLDSSYRRLAPAHRKLFLLLSVNPGPDLSAEAATVLAERTAPPRVRRGLATLARASLVRADPETGRWRMHDLVRAYAVEQSGLAAEQREAALDRLLDHYTAGARDANVQLSPGATGDRTHFRDRRRALSWLDAEHANLIAAVQAARSARRHRVGVELPAHLKEYLTLRNRTEELTTVMGVALDAARSCGDRIGEARAWNDLGNALSKPDPARAADAYRTSIARYQELGIRHGAAVARHNLTTLPSRVGRVKDAERFEESAATHRSLRTTFLALGDRPGVAACDLTVGLCLYRLGRNEEALESIRLALTGFQESGDRSGEADTWGNLGVVLNGSGRATEAVAAFRTAVDMYRDLDDRRSTATAHLNLAVGLLAVGEPADAVEADSRAVALFRELGMAHAEGEALEKLARCLRSAGGPDAERRSVCEAAAAVYRRFGDEAGAERVLGLLP